MTDFTSMNSSICYKFTKKRITSFLTFFLPYFLLCLNLLLPVLLLTGCSQSKVPKKVKDLDFTIVAGTDIPDELQKLITARKKEAFQLTYSDGTYLYVCRGYGKQPTGGYNIVVEDFYQGKDCLVFHSEFFGPKEGEATSGNPSYPYIVLKTEFRQEDVEFIPLPSTTNKDF